MVVRLVVSCLTLVPFFLGEENKKLYGCGKVQVNYVVHCVIMHINNEAYGQLTSTEEDLFSIKQNEVYW